MWEGISKMYFLKTFILSLMEYWSPLWTGIPASHLAQLVTVETNAFKIIGMSHDEAESMGHSLSQHRQIGGFSIFCQPSGLASSTLSMRCLLQFLQGTHSPPSTSSWSNSQNKESLFTSRIIKE